MIQKLSKKQEKSLKEICNKWRDKIINEPTRSLDVITKNIRFLYEDNGFSFEDVEIKVCDYNEFIEEIKSPAVNSAVNSAVYSAVNSAVNSAVYSAVYSAVRLAVYYNSDYISFGDFFFENNILTNKKLKDKFYKYVDAIQDFGMIYLTEKKAILLAKPKVEVDSEGRTRRLIWNDNCTLYFINGTQFEKEWWEKITEDKLTPQEIFAIDNIEHRRIAYELMDKTKMKQLKDYKVLDEVKDDGYGNPMKIVSFEVQDLTLKFLNCFCPSTGREYYLQVEKDKCWEAKNASFGLKNVEWVKEW